MSARKATSTKFDSDKVTIKGQQACLSLSEDAVVIQRTGIEFRTGTAFEPWTEMTIALHARDNTIINCGGVVISCTGNRHTGYHVSMVFTSLTKQAQAQLEALAHSSLA
jgi:hypothetical protein